MSCPVRRPDPVYLGGNRFIRHLKGPLQAGHIGKALVDAVFFDIGGVAPDNINIRTENRE